MFGYTKYVNYHKGKEDKKMNYSELIQIIVDFIMKIVAFFKSSDNTEAIDD